MKRPEKYYIAQVLKNELNEKHAAFCEKLNQIQLLQNQLQAYRDSAIDDLNCIDHLNTELGFGMDEKVELKFFIEVGSEESYEYHSPSYKELNEQFEVAVGLKRKDDGFYQQFRWVPDASKDVTKSEEQ